MAAQVREFRPHKNMLVLDESTFLGAAHGFSVTERMDPNKSKFRVQVFFFFFAKRKVFFAQKREREKRTTMSDKREPALEQLAQYTATQKSKVRATTSNGAPVDALTSSMTAGAKGPIVLQDFVLLDHMAAFDRERIPERVVHAKGAGNNCL